ncbi:MAG: hypothetical protein ACPHID_00800 [Thermoplasmatota archaeon]
MAFSKFDPHKPEEEPEPTVGDRRALILQWGWKITLIYTLFGFAMIGYFMVEYGN